MKALTEKAKRIIVFFIGLMGFVVALGWTIGSIDGRDALIVITAILTGFFGLLKGIE